MTNVHPRGAVRGVDWHFNAWGGLSGGLYFPWDRDDEVAQKVLEIEGDDRYRAPFVLEGGAIHVDGQGTCLTTEECLLNPNRNPGLSRADIEEGLRRYLGVTAVIWLDREGELISVDSRPSDALALALRLDCPIYVEESVLKSSKVASSISDRVNDAELRRWLEGLNDEDLGRYKM